MAVLIFFLHTCQNGENLEHWKQWMLVRMRSNRSSHPLWVRMQHGAATLETIWQFLTRGNMLFLPPSNCSPRYLPKWTANVCPHKNMHINVDSRFMHSCQIWKSTKDINQDFPQWVLGWVGTVLFTSKKRWATSHEKTCYWVKETNLIPTLWCTGKGKL